MKPKYQDWLNAQDVEDLAEFMLPDIRAGYLRRIANASRRALRSSSSENVANAISEIDCCHHNVKLIQAALDKAAKGSPTN